MTGEAAPTDPAQVAEERVDEIFTSAFGSNGTPSEIVAEFVRKTIEGDPKVNSVIGEKWGAPFDEAAAFMNSDGQNESVNAASQVLYYSTQLEKIDLSALTLSYDALKMDEQGVTFLGAKVYDWPWIDGLEKWLGTASPDNSENSSQTPQRPQASPVDTARESNREIYSLKVESERSYTRIRTIHTEAKAFTQDIESKTRRAGEEFVRIVRTIDQALAG
ncbi:hypothetical protein WDH52_17520 [Streptomyces sp. TRM70308]|uniref:hypothetical protein n=1 Tax=Streptomyces sp. TRM70308 TaxID=3131932 RepID=UPI003D03D7A8